MGDRLKNNSPLLKEDCVANSYNKTYIILESCEKKNLSCKE
jgi:hypothetical protein